MGTNYYVVKNKCDCCGRSDIEYHIGKASYGWAFSFQGYSWNKLTSWRNWKEFLKNQIIENEYGERVDYNWFVEMVETYKSPNYNDNKSHNAEGKKNGWYSSEHDWDDEDGYSFTNRQFS